MTPFDDIKALITSAPEGDDAAFDKVGQSLDGFKGPKPVIGNWENPVKWLARWQGTPHPAVRKPLIAVFAGTHGVAESYLDDSDLAAVARARIESLTQGSAAVRGMAGSLNAAFKVYEMGTEHPCANIAESPSLSERECAGAIAFGMEVVAEGADIIALGNAGLGSATAAAAIARSLYGGASEYWAGAHNLSAERRIAAVEAATNLNKDLATNPLEGLRCFGGRDIAGMVGAIVAARHQSIPVILDGFVVCAAAAIIHAIDPHAIDHCMAGHLSAEPAHGALLDRMGLTPLHDFGISLGDGTGAAYALNSLKISAAAFETLHA